MNNNVPMIPVPLPLLQAFYQFCGKQPSEQVEQFRFALVRIIGEHEENKKNSEKPLTDVDKEKYSKAVEKRLRKGNKRVVDQPTKE